MNRLYFSLGLLAIAGGATFACGGISDPRRIPENTSTVSGALSGAAVPSGAHVALVWRVGKSGGLAVGSDAPIVDGKFTMTLGALPDSYYFAPEGSGDGDVIVGPGTPNTGTPPPDTREEGPRQEGQKQQWQQPSQKLAPRDQASGSITTPLGVAIAGFVVYVDSNGNGKLDIEGSHAGTPDLIIAGNRDFSLVNFKGGGALDYEKMRDKSNVVPGAGYNLLWEEQRFMPLNVVELKLASAATLPRAVCVATMIDGPVHESVPNTNQYPSADDPNLRCSEDGRSFDYDGVPQCGRPEAPPAGLCSDDAPTGDEVPQCTAYPDRTLGPTDPVPAGWPCPIPFGGGDGR